MTDKTQRPDWLKAFFPQAPRDKDAYGALLELGQTSLQQAVTAQQAVLALYRQLSEGEGDGDGRSLRVRQEEVMRKTLELLDPVFVIEQSTRQQVAKAQTAFFELCEEALRGVARFGEERGRSKSA
jgi:hypothetical protein